MSDACFTCVNPALASAYNPGGRAGAIVYGATNKGPLSDAYKFCLGPHIGVAYQIDSEDRVPRRWFNRLLLGGRQCLPVLQRGELLHRRLARAIPPGQSTGEWKSRSRAVTFPSYDQYPFPISKTGCGLTGNIGLRSAHGAVYHYPKERADCRASSSGASASSRRSCLTWLSMRPTLAIAAHGSRPHCWIPSRSMA